MDTEKNKPLIQVNVKIPEIWKPALTRIFNIIGEPLVEGSGILTDWLKYQRIKNLVSISEKLNLLDISDDQIRATQQKLSTGQNMKLIEYSSLADDEYLQQKWANLIANAVLTTNFHSLYSELLNSLEPLDAHLLDSMVNNSKPKGLTLSEIQVLINSPEEQLKISLANMARLGLVMYGMTAHGGSQVGVIPAKVCSKTKYFVSDLGIHLKNICEIKIEPCKQK